VLCVQQSDLRDDFGWSGTVDALRRMRRCTRSMDGFPEPLELAEVLYFSVVSVAYLPGDAGYMTDGSTIWLQGASQRVCGTRLFLGISSAILGLDGQSRTPGGIWTMAARLAAPPLLMRSVGLDETVRRQTWATRSFLRAWWDA
jgi:hypothetical protein